jgi:PAS domain S-box-containing protein
MRRFEEDRSMTTTPWLVALLALIGAAVLIWAQRGSARSREAALEQRLARLEQQIQEQGEQLERSEAARADAEAALRANEERYLLAARCSQDGLWEWDLASDAVHLSPRWKGMLGFEADDLADDRAVWFARIHPDDRAAFEAAAQRHLRDGDPRCEHEMRLLHKDGSVRHVLSRSVALRRENGEPYRLIGLDTDVTRLRRVQSILDAVAEGTAGAFGERFFAAMAQHFARALEVDCAFIAECIDHPPTRVRTLAYWTTERGLADNFEFQLSGTPCDQVLNEARTCFHRENLAQLFPRERGYESYLGMPILASDGRVLGHLALRHRKPLDDSVLADLVYRIFLARAGAEIERLHALARLARLQAVVT